jgi:hypothetical protein
MPHLGSPPVIREPVPSRNRLSVLIATCLRTYSSTVLDASCFLYLHICGKSPDSGMQGRLPSPECPDRAWQGIPLSPGSAGTGRAIGVCGSWRDRLPRAGRRAREPGDLAKLETRRGRDVVGQGGLQLLRAWFRSPGREAQHAPAPAAGVSCMWVREKCHLDDYAAVQTMQTPQRCGATAAHG